MQRIAKVMQELGPCAEVVQKTTMECFFIMESGVRQAYSEDGQGLTPSVNQKIGEKAGTCYERGLMNLGQCLAEQ